MAWVGIITWTNLLAILRDMVNESTSTISDAKLMSCTNAAILSVRGELFVPLASATITTPTTGTYKYDVPANFVAIEEVRVANEPLPDYAWNLGIGADAEIYFVSPYYDPVTGTAITVCGWKVQPVIAAAGDYLGIDPGYIQYRALANAHSMLGKRGAERGIWHQNEHNRLAALAEARLKDEIALAKYRPSATARLVPGRVGG